MRVLLTVCILLIATRAVTAQPDPELVEGAEVVSGLSQSASIRLDPAGLIYIADPGRHVIDVRGPDGTPVSVIGGPGTGGQQFDGPMDIDPTNGLLLAVADAGNSRIARFSADHQLTESTPLYGSSRERFGQSALVLEGDDAESDLTPGRPVAVVLNESNETYAIDETRRVVVKWNVSRRLVSVIGDIPGYGQLLEPVDLEILGDQLYVADVGAGSIVVFDLFGGFVTEIGGGRLVDIFGLGTAGRDLWVLHGRNLTVYSSNGTLQSRFRLPMGVVEPVDVAITDRFLYVLTRTNVFRWALDARGRPLTMSG